MDQSPRESVRIGAYIWQQRAAWRDLLSAARTADGRGFASLWTWDHLLAGPTDPREPIFEGWTTLAAWAATTEHATVGPLVGAVMLRNPGLVAKMITTIDHISGGRAVLGLGAGWYELEHSAHGIPFGRSFGDRLDHLAEAVPLIRALLDGKEVTDGGRHYRFEKAFHAPPPLQSRIPILIGGSGRLRTLRIVAEFGDMWHATDRRFEDLVSSDAVLRQHCDVVRRDPGEIERLTSKWVAIRERAPEAEAVLNAGAERHGYRRSDDPSSQPGARIAGSPEAVAEQLWPYIRAGFRHVLWTFRSPFDLETMERLPGVLRLLGATPATDDRRATAAG